MKPDNRSYEYLIKHFTEKEIKDRFLVIYNGAREYIQQAGISECTAVNEFIIDEILLDYYADIDRLKDFHNIELAEPKKVAAYTSYWIQKRKPIQLIKNPDEETLRKYPQINWINENFAISILFSMAFDMAKPPLVPAGILIRLTEFQKSLRYYFTFRHVNAQMLELLLKGIDVLPMYPSITAEA